MTTITNQNSYAQSTSRPRKTLTVTFITDQVAGAYHDPVDLMKWIAQNPYVATVTYEEPTLIRWRISWNFSSSSAARSSSPSSSPTRG
jgi:hypothetical protein